VLFAVHLNSKSNDAPIYDVRLDSAQASAQIRDKFGNLINESRRSKQKLPDFLAGVYISNVVNLSTVVKVEILKVLKEQFNAKFATAGTRTAFVKSFSSQPTFHVRPLQKGGGAHLSLGYTEAVTQFRDLLRHDLLESAYRRVGMNYIGQLERNFLVLTEDGRTRYQSIKGSSTQSATASASTSASTSASATSGSNSQPLGKPKTLGTRKRGAGGLLPDSTPAKK
jgi:hypothetical protein